MKKFKKLSLILMLTASFFLTGCDAEQIMQTINNVAQAVQQAAPAIGQVIESVQGIFQSFDSLSSNNQSSTSSTQSSSSQAPAVEQSSTDSPAVFIPPAGEQETIARPEDGVIEVTPDNSDDNVDSSTDNDSVALPILGQLGQSLQQLQQRITSGESAAEIKTALESLKQRLDQVGRVGAAFSENIKQAYEELSAKVVSLEEQIEEQLSQEAPTALSQKVLRIAVGLDPVDLRYDIDGDGRVTAQDSLQLLRLETARANTDYSNEVRNALAQLEQKFAQAASDGSEMPEDLKKLYEDFRAAQ